MSPARPHAVLICFACDPGAGSEEGVGWAWAKAAARLADVTLLTTSAAADKIREAVLASDLPITVRSPDALWIRRLARRKLIFLYYVMWQMLAARELRRIEASRRVDILHHLTWASDSLPSALLASNAPIRIWGPVGGSTGTALGLYRYLSARGAVDQVVRDVINGFLRRTTGRWVARHASLVAALNHDARRTLICSGTPVVVEGNLALDPAELAGMTSGPQPSVPNGLKTAVFAGRLIPWKGLLLAIEGLRHAPGWRLLVLGDGPDRSRAAARAAKLGLTDRIEFRGRVSRTEALATFARADAMLFPSFHDSAPWAVGEAAALGCPVVCLDAGGVAMMAGRNAHSVPVKPSRSLPVRLGARLQAIDHRGQPDATWRAERLENLLAGWYTQAPRGRQEVLCGIQ